MLRHADCWCSLRPPQPLLLPRSTRVPANSVLWQYDQHNRTKNNPRIHWYDHFLFFILKVRWSTKGTWPFQRISEHERTYFSKWVWFVNIWMLALKPSIHLAPSARLRSKRTSCFSTLCQATAEHGRVRAEWVGTLCQETCRLTPSARSATARLALGSFVFS